MAERREHALALALGFIAVNGLGADAGFAETTHQLVGAVLGAGENEGAVDRLVAQKVGKHRGFALPVHMDDALGNAVDRRCHRRHRDLCGVSQHRSREFRYRLRHGGRKEKRLPLRRQFRHDLADVSDEAHVEHAIGFVEHQKVNPVEPERIALHQIEQPARRGDENIDSIEDSANLLSHRDAANHEGAGDADVATISAEAIEDLAGEFPRRAENKHATALAFSRHPLGEHVVQDGECECGGLAGARLGNSDDVSPGESERHGLCLDGSGDQVVFLGKRASDGRGEAETLKRGQSTTFRLATAAPAEGTQRRISRVIMTSRVVWAAVR